MNIFFFFKCLTVPDVDHSCYHHFVDCGSKKTCCENFVLMFLNHEPSSSSSSKAPFFLIFSGGEIIFCWNTLTDAFFLDGILENCIKKHRTIRYRFNYIKDYFKISLLLPKYKWGQRESTMQVRKIISELINRRAYL